MKKAITVVLPVLLAAGGLTWYFVSFRMDDMIERRIEDTASRSFGTRVSVGSVTTDVRSGSLTIADIAVANPPGFRNPNALSLSSVEAAVDYASLDVESVVIDRPDIVIEEIGGETNFSRMLRELEKRHSGPEAAGDAQKEPEIVIRHFRLNASRAAFESASLDRSSEFTVDAVELNDIRGTPTEVAEIIATEVVREIAADAARAAVKARAQNMLDEAGDRLGGKLSEMLGGDRDPDDG